MTKPKIRLIEVPEGHFALCDEDDARVVVPEDVIPENVTNFTHCTKCNTLVRPRQTSDPTKGRDKALFCQVRLEYLLNHMVYGYCQCSPDKTKSEREPGEKTTDKRKDRLIFDWLEKKWRVKKNLSPAQLDTLFGESSGVEAGVRDERSQIMEGAGSEDPASEIIDMLERVVDKETRKKMITLQIDLLVAAADEKRRNELLAVFQSALPPDGMEVAAAMSPKGGLKRQQVNSWETSESSEPGLPEADPTELREVDKPSSGGEKRLKQEPGVEPVPDAGLMGQLDISGRGGNDESVCSDPTCYYGLANMQQWLEDVMLPGVP